ncbi:MAG TPA: rhodanese-like domain-containing protein, partial [Nitrolancea sp.]|nr:rhodanese-like domain-containing protein [Nitrolancea sp.]
MSSATNSKPGVLVSTQWVADHLNDPNVRLVEVDVDTTAYDSGHTPNTIGWNWQTQLQRHPSRDIPTKEEWQELLSSSGISNDTHVVLFGDNNNWFAAFAYWIFKLYGHENVSLMDGGRKKWFDENRESTTESPP